MNSLVWVFVSVIFYILRRENENLKKLVFLFELIHGNIYQSGFAHTQIWLIVLNVDWALHQLIIFIISYLYKGEAVHPGTASCS